MHMILNEKIQVVHAQSYIFKKHKVNETNFIIIIVYCLSC